MGLALSYTAVTARKRPGSSGHTIGLLLEYLVDLSILLLAALIAWYLRRAVPLGMVVDDRNRWPDPRIYLAIVFGLTAAHAMRLVSDGAWLGRGRRRLQVPIIGVVLAGGLVTVVVPGHSRLQTGYFAALALLLILLVVPWYDGTGGRFRPQSFGVNLTRLWANRSLLQLWVRYNVRSRYAQAILGILWIALLPFSSALIMTIVFSEIMRIPTGDAPYISFLLAGLVPWGLFSQSVSAGMRSILNEMGLIKQAYFPREIIVLSALGEALVDAGFMFGTMLLVNAAVGVWPNALYAALPLLVTIQLAMSLGLMLLLSCLSVLIRDIPQLVTVLLQLAFYLCPILYPLSIVPERYRFLIALNPLAVLIDAYRGIIVYGRAPDWLSLLYPGALAFGILVFGYRFFKANEARFADLA